MRNTTTNNSNNTTTFFCVFQEAEDDDPANRRGFDSLRNNGYARSEVTAIRGYFSAQVREVRQTLLILMLLLLHSAGKRRGVEGRWGGCGVAHLGLFHPTKRAWSVPIEFPVGLGAEGRGEEGASTWEGRGGSRCGIGNKASSARMYDGA